ncbi:hypothetical protein [Halomonas icarae]|uniref:Uncharacterized protein n=1 Tax=Halomonas icarae TaxID=2691040 RepID=A0A7X5AKZ1_9GAMM|nr:hypothetical protein [Halomonas icarae]MDR5901048.1 hypothetical protein [Halomonas icarae]NAW11324.1 hypothetical protein [Halomonas icarae]
MTRALCKAVPLVLAIMLAGCGGEETSSPESTEAADDRTTADEVSSASESREPASTEEAPKVPPFDEPVTFELSSRLESDRRLTVEGETNLPQATRLQVIVERELSGVRWRGRVSVAEGGFVAGPFGPGSGLPDGGYRVTVDVQEGSVQPRSVRERLGEENEHLSGPLVHQSRHGLGQVARYSQRFLVGSETRRTHDQVEVIRVE